jgi:hypothetical protein
LEQEQPAQAVAAFKKVLAMAQAGSRLKRDAAFYLKLAYLQAGSWEEGKQ